MFNLNSDSEDENNGENTLTYGKSKNWRMKPLNMWNGRFQFFILRFFQILFIYLTVFLCQTFKKCI